MRKIDPAERWLIVGTTGSGKSTATKWLLLHYPPPLVLIDSKRTAYPSFKPVSVKAAIGLLSRRLRDMPKVVRVTPELKESDALEGLYDAALRRGNVTIVEDEALLIPDSESRKFVFITGRSEGVGIISCTQRPVGVIREAVSESERKWEFLLHDKKDRQRVSEFSGLPYDVEVQRFHSLYYDSSDGQVQALDPVPDLKYDAIMKEFFK